MKNQPLVSVIIPLYNNEKYIEDALNSVFAQDYSNLEVIVVNDGSTDNSVAALDKFLDRIILINQENAGTPTARNTGIEHSTGKYVSFLDADDIWLQGKITAQVSFMEENPDFGGVHANMVKWIVSERGPLDLTYDFLSLENDVSEQFSGWILKEVLDNKCNNAITFMFKRKLLIEIGMYHVHLYVGADFDLCLRMASKVKIHKLNKVSAVYRVNNESISFKYEHALFIHKIISNLENSITLEELTNNNVNIRDIKNRLSIDYLKLASFHLWKNSVLKSLKYLIKSLINNPLNIKIYHFAITQFFKIPLKIFMPCR